MKHLLCFSVCIGRVYPQRLGECGTCKLIPYLSPQMRPRDLRHGSRPFARRGRSGSGRANAMVAICAPVVLGLHHRAGSSTNCDGDSEVLVSHVNESIPSAVLAQTKLQSVAARSCGPVAPKRWPWEGCLSFRDLFWQSFPQIRCALLATFGRGTGSECLTCPEVFEAWALHPSQPLGSFRTFVEFM